MTSNLRAAWLFLFVGCALAAPPEPLGERPAYLDRVDAVPNEHAIERRLWVPGLEDGFVPQGLTVEGEHVLVSSYRSADPKVNTGPCRVFRIEVSTGRVAGAFDMPVSACTHAGGLAYLGGGMLALADTRQIFRIDLAKALETGSAEAAIKGAVKLAGDLRGSFAAFDGKHFWIGTWTKEAAKARMFALDPSIFDEQDGQTIDHTRALESIPIPLEVQGAAFDSTGDLWLSASSGRFGFLYRLDRRGTIKSRWDMTIGLEDLEFDATGRLWAVSESGTRKYLHWDKRFPFVFEIDVAKLK